jgi:hypothetical protein
MNSDVGATLGALLGTLLIIAAIIGGFWLLVATNTTLERATVEAEMRCSNAGYQEAVLRHDTYYCATFGLEPKVAWLGPVDALDRAYQERKNDN